MNLLATVFGTRNSTSSQAEDGTSQEPRRARCRNCGRYYGAGADACPHCGSGNKLLAGPPGRQRDRK